MVQLLPNDQIKITVSDPNRELGAMHLSLSKRIETEGENFMAFWNERKQESEIIIDLPQGQYAGSSVSVGL